MDLKKEARESNAGEPIDWGAIWDAFVSQMTPWDWIAAPFWLALFVGMVAIPLAYVRSRRPLEGTHVRRRRTGNHARRIMDARRRPDEQKGKRRQPLPGGLSVLADFVLVLGGSNTGKSKRILMYVIAYLLRQARRSLFAIDPKGQLYGLSKALLGAWSGRPRVGLVSTLKKHPDDEVDPINPMLDRETALAFLKASIPGEDGTKDRYFDNASQRLGYLTSRAQIAERGGTDCAALYDAMSGPRELDRLAQKYPGLVGREWKGSDEARGPHESNRSTFVAAWTGMEIPRIRRIFDTKGAWLAGPTWEERTVLFLCVRPKDAANAPGLIKATVEYLVGEASEAHERGGPKVDAILEEAGTFAPSGHLELWVNLFRELGVNAWIVVQSRHQLVDKLGAEKVKSMLASITAIIAGPTGSTEDAEWIETRAGYVEVEREDGPPKREPRYPRDKLLVNENDPQRHENRLVRAVAQAWLWITGRHVLQDGMYVVINRGSAPYVLDARSAYYPAYAPDLRPKGGKPKIRRLRSRRPDKPLRPAADPRVLPPADEPATRAEGYRNPETQAYHTAPTFSRPFPAPATDPPHRREEDRALEREAARKGALERARADAQAGPDDPPPANPTVPTWDKDGPDSLVIRNDRAMVTCAYCGEDDNPASAEKCKTCDESLSQRSEGSNHD